MDFRGQTFHAHFVAMSTRRMAVCNIFVVIGETFHYFAFQEGALGSFDLLLVTFRTEDKRPRYNDITMCLKDYRSIKGPLCQIKL